MAVSHGHLQTITSLVSRVEGLDLQILKLHCEIRLTAPEREQIPAVLLRRMCLEKPVHGLCPGS
jgi:hypothetical protein